MDLKQIESFVRVAEQGSFSKAAAVLNLPQPALSRHVRRLEVELRDTLFERTGRGVRLTEAGRRIFEHGVAILQLVARAREEAGAQRDKPLGRVVVGMPPSIGRRLTPGLVEAFKHQCPQAQLAIVEALSADLAEWIASGRLDLALLHNPEPHEAIETTPLLEEALCLVSPAGSGGAGEPLSLEELPRYPLVLPGRGHAMRRLLEAQVALAGIALDVAWEVSSVPSIIDLVVLGHGHAVLSGTAVAISGRAQALQTRPLVRPEVTSTLCLAAPATKRLPPLGRHVRGLLTKLVAALPRG